MPEAALQPEPRTWAAFLFDMDGTLLNSIASANRVWSQWAERHGLDPAELIPVIHGVQTQESVRRFAPAGVDVLKEAAYITQREIEEVEGIVEVPGARRFLDSLPPHRWAIVTSASRRLALRRMQAAGIPVPPVLIAAEDVARGKPQPDCFLAAAAALGVAVTDCLIWEDSPAGIAAAEAAEASVVVVTETHRHPMEIPHRSAKDYSRLRVSIGEDGRLQLAARVD